MLKVGITGGIGSGKSTVTNMLKEKLLPIIDADIVAREVFIINPEVISQIKEEFGYEFFDEEGKLRRKEFGNYIFKNDTLRKKLERIIMPFIINEINRRIKAYEQDNCKICFLDAPTLIENNLHTSMDVIILVWVSSDVQIQRIMLRDDLDLDAAMDRIRAQMPIDEKRKFADFIIDNGGSIENTKLQLDLIITQLERLDVKDEV
ncbi:dephospho-CoA kinase [Clostridium tagluense]|uniref:dephospho-CoA kinase n=1 Tax=Clostridium tagluense TaxID=360422 RepID=UPI001C0E2CBC|nr:dephospho-CoA kinase [Clostridium tagluense]MBU3128384.1 dephospho-CoA kinase [Clostridium tagluense]MCB2313158.1 dephospho-CoA kinase [Clostridium tagluense]MCB2317924.1 dephospho-CoA kinase [Clostridium tagluense]MCB2322764.1 dephospho-CoA kinase [Clostridium tagluense]MCB2327762.1 dephospho-CoA kinase [Clostridium tagluense]